MSDPHDVSEAPIPLLTDVLVPGNPLLARDGGLGAADTLAAAAVQPVDVDALAARLRGRCLSWLSGDGRAVIETRCRDALQEHASWLVGQVAREIGLALETELTGWVRAAVHDELAARPGQRSTGTQGAPYGDAGGGGAGGGQA